MLCPWERLRGAQHLARDLGQQLQQPHSLPVVQILVKRKKLGTLEMEVELRIIGREGNPTPFEVEK